LFSLFLAGGFDALEFLAGFEEGALQAALDLRHTAEHGGAGLGARLRAWSTRCCSAGF
jgi:hypothetical protein